MTSSIDFAKLQTLIEMNAEINSNYSDMDALLMHILDSAMRLVQSEAASFSRVREDGSIQLLASLGQNGPVQSPVLEKNSFASWVAENNKSLVINNITADSPFNEYIQKNGRVISKVIALPVRKNGRCLGVIELINKSSSRNYNNEDHALLEVLSNCAALAYENALQCASARDRISALQHALDSGSGFHPFLAKSPVILDLLHVLDEIAKTSAAVLITGESGVGKELFAEQLHLKSPRAKEPFVRINCACLSSALLEEAFLKAAKGGTLFLDEIAELPLDLQEKVLRVMQVGSFEKNSGQNFAVDLRIVAATSRDLEKLVSEGKFRSDLFYRLNVLPLYIPPLRERKEDIESLALFFLQDFSGATKKQFTAFSPQALRTLYDYYWPGNIRELKNSIERACMLGTPPLIQAEDLQLSVPSGSRSSAEADSSFDAMAEDALASPDGDRTLKSAITKFKTAYVKRILKETSWNQTEAGKILGIQRTYVSRLLNELHIR